jgi:hypothetical protein
VTIGSELVQHLSELLKDKAVQESLPSITIG